MTGEVRELQDRLRQEKLLVLCLAWVGMCIDLKASLEATEVFEGVSDTKGQHCLGCSEVLRMG